MWNLQVVASLGIVVGLAACTKSEGGGASTSTSATAVAVPSEAPTIAITGTPPPAPSASAAASASATPSATATAATTTAATTTTKTSPSAKSAASVAPAASAAKEAPLKPTSTRVSGKNFTLDVASPGCRVDTPCTMTLRLAAVGDFHVNKEYPYKFVATAAPNVQFLGKTDASTFSREAGDYQETGEKTSTMTVRFKPTAAGEARVGGTYKMSVCSASACQIEQQAVQLAVPVM